MGAMTEMIILPEELGNQNDIPLVSGAKVFMGSAIGLDSGYGQALVNGNIFAGHALEGADNTSGVSGDVSVKVQAGTYKREVTLASVAQANVSDKVYMTYDGTYTLSDTDSVLVGRVVRYVATDTCMVEFTANQL